VNELDVSSILIPNWVQECYNFVLNILCVISDVIACCVWSCDTGKLNVGLYDKIVIETQKRRENMKIKEMFI